MRLLTRKVAFIILTTLILSMTSVPCFAAKSVDLKKNDYWRNSGEFRAKQTRFNGYTNKSNPRPVWFIAEYEDSSGFHYDKKHKVGAGANCPTSDSYTMKYNVTWRLQLNPYGSGTRGCVASGSIWKRK
ncbi:MAG: hypothetical protein PHD70_02000 [Anaerostipes sp.]|nr:hypothetical protein [Anaerostipes sp.]MDD3745230.1 hypothetical protein [Anaerostipes sp.]